MGRNAGVWNEITGPVEFGLQASTEKFAIDRYFEAFVPGDTVARGGPVVIGKGDLGDARRIGWCFSRTRVVVKDTESLLKFSSQEVLTVGTW